jgi:hypothetical protein
MELQYFFTPSNILSICTKYFFHALFCTSRVRFPTETQLFRAIIKYGRLIAGGASDTKQPSPILTLSKKTRAFEIGCIVAKKGAEGPIFEGNMLPKKMYPFFMRR